MRPLFDILPADPRGVPLRRRVPAHARRRAASPTVIADVDRPAAGTALRFEGKEVRFPPRANEAVAAIAAATGLFTAGQLPGPLDNAGRLVLVTRLVREGFLRQPRV